MSSDSTSTSSSTSYLTQYLDIMTSLIIQRVSGFDTLIGVTPSPTISLMNAFSYLLGFTNSPELNEFVEHLEVLDELTSLYPGQGCGTHESLPVVPIHLIGVTKYVMLPFLDFL